MGTDPNVEAVRTKLLERSKRGLSKYGTDTTRDDIDLCGWLRHLQEEMMDAAVYIERTLSELTDDKHKEMIKKFREISKQLGELG